MIVLEKNNITRQTCPPSHSTSEIMTLWRFINWIYCYYCYYYH